MKLLRRPHGESGLTLLEVAFSLALFALLIVPLYLLLVRSREQSSAGSHYRTARLAASTVVERMRAQANRTDTGSNSFETLAADWTPDWSSGWVDVVMTDPNGTADPETGNRFFVPGLPRRKDPADPDGPHGVITFPITESSGTVYIDESVYGLDLDASGASTDLLELDDKYRALPVRVEVFWGPEDEPKFTIETVISKRDEYLRSTE